MQVEDRTSSELPEEGSIGEVGLCCGFSDVGDREAFDGDRSAEGYA